MSTGYRAMLTGATGGLGRVMALKLAPLCETLVLLVRKQSVGEALAERLRQDNPHVNIEVMVGDLNNPEFVTLCRHKARDIRCNLLINNAGVNHFGPAEGIGNQAVDQVLSTNLLAPIVLTNALIPVLKQQSDAQVVLVGSIFGYIGYPGNAAYCASKFGLRGYAQALKRELADSSVKVKYFAPRAASTAINHGPVEALNRELKVTEDSPEKVALELVRFLGLNQFELKIGWPEKLFVFLNQLFPGINDKAIQGQLPTIRKHFIERNPS